MATTESAARNHAEPTQPETLLPENWQDLVRSTLPPILQDRWLNSAPRNPQLFKLVIAAFEEGKKPGNECRFAISTPAGVQWRETLEEADTLRDELRSAYGNMIFVAAMDESPPTHFLCSMIAKTAISTTTNTKAFMCGVNSPTFASNLWAPGLFDTGCSHMTLAKDMMPETEVNMERIRVVTASGVSECMRLRENVEICLQVNGAQLRGIVIPEITFGITTLIGLNVIGEHRWTIKKNHFGVVELSGQDVDVDIELPGSDVGSDVEMSSSQ